MDELRAVIDVFGQQVFLLAIIATPVALSISQTGQLCCDIADFGDPPETTLFDALEDNGKEVHLFTTPPSDHSQ
eukprot:12923431-Prorocentrum_lima.AAC.1